MASMDTTRFADLCRLCAAKTTVGLAINIFENEGAIRQLNKKIETCLPLHVHEIDSLPKMMCENCLYKLELFFEFRERCVRTEALLINLYNKITHRIAAKQNIVHINDPLDIVSMDHDLIMVPQQQLLNDHDIQNVGDLGLNELNHRESMIVGHEIILTHQPVDINNHSLDHMDLHHQELSNHSLQAQNGILVDENGSVHSLQDARFATDTNLDLIHQGHQIVNDSYALHDVHQNQHEINHNLHQHDVNHHEIVQHNVNNQITTHGVPQHELNHHISQNLTLPVSNVAELQYADSTVHLQEELSEGVRLVLKLLLF